MVFTIVRELKATQKNQILYCLGQVHKARNKAANATFLEFVPFEETELSGLLADIDSAGELLASVAERIEAAEDVTE